MKRIQRSARILACGPRATEAPPRHPVFRLSSIEPAAMREIKKDISVFLPNPDQSTLDIKVRLLLPRNARREVDGLISSLNLAPGDEVLEIPCGDGACAVEMARRGMRVVAVGGRKHDFRLSQSKAECDRLDVRFESSDESPVELSREYFSGAICDLGAYTLSRNSWLHSLSGDDCRRVQVMWHSLRPGGRLLISAFHRRWMARHATSCDWSLWADPVLVNHRRFHILQRRSVFVVSSLSSRESFQAKNFPKGYEFNDLVNLVRDLDGLGRVTPGKCDYLFGGSESPVIQLVAEKQLKK